MDELHAIDGGLLNASRRLRVRLVPQPIGADRAETPTPRAGVGLEYRDFRPYTPGDDLRRLDWNVYKRTGRLQVKLFDEPRRMRVRLLVDTSGSMRFEHPPRLAAARAAAVALAAACLEDHHRVEVARFATGRIETREPAADSPRGLGPLASRVLTWPMDTPKGQPVSTGLAGVLDGLSKEPGPAGLLVLVSDFFDAAGVDAWSAALRRLRDRVLMVRVSREADARPDLAGDVMIEDCEGGPPLRLTADRSALARYRQAYASFETQLQHTARSCGGRLLNVDADRPVVDQLAAAARRGVLEIRGGGEPVKGATP